MSISDDYPGLLATVVVSQVHWVEASNGFAPSGAIPGGRALHGEVVYIGRTRLLENHSEWTPGILVPSSKCLFVSYGTGSHKSTKYEVLVANNPSSVHWVACCNGSVPTNAVIGGIDCSYSEPLYIGRTRGKLTLGRTWRGQRFPDPFNQTAPTLTSPELSSPYSSPNLSAHRRNKKTAEIEGEIVSKNKRDEDIQPVLPGKIHPSHKCLYIPYKGKEYLFRNYEVLTLTITPASMTNLCKIQIHDHLINIILISQMKNRKNDSRRLSNSSIADEEDMTFIEKSLSEKIDGLPLPLKLKEFCKQGME